MTTAPPPSDDDLARSVQRAVRELPDAPATWQREAIALWPAGTRPLVAAAQALGDFIVAALRFDSWAQPAFGMRSVRAPTRHLLYSAEGRDIDLRITPADEHFAITGQILGPDETGQVELSPTGSPAGPSHRGSLDALGEFRIADVPRGRYLLTLHLGPHPIVVQALEVGEPVA